MARPHHLDAHFASALYHRIEIIHLEPQQHAITVGSVRTIADRAVMMFRFKAVQLQDEPAILHQLLILLAAVPTAATQQALIPQAAAFDIRDADEGLGAHGSDANGCAALANRSNDTSEAATSDVSVLGVRELAPAFSDARFASLA